MTSDQADRLISDIAGLFDRRGRDMYAGEPVTQTEHALQTAWQAQQEEAANPLIERRPCCTTWVTCCTIWGKTVPTKELTIGTKRWAPSGWPAIFEQRRHRAGAAACRRQALPLAVDPLITPLVGRVGASLKLQGGPFTESQARHFEQHPYFQRRGAAAALGRSGENPGTGDAVARQVPRGGEKGDCA